MKICILNASNPVHLNLEADEYTDLRDRSSCFQGKDKIIKQCRSFHSWAYALEAEFFVYGKPGWAKCFSYDGIMVLVNRDIDKIIPVIEKLKSLGKVVSITYHEGVEDLCKNLPKVQSLRRAISISDFYANFIGHYRPFFLGLGAKEVKNIEHTNPFDWENSLFIPFEKKTKNILLGTRTLSTSLSRNTFTSLMVLNYLKKEYPSWRVSWVSEDRISTEEIYNHLGVNTDIEIIQGPFEYTEWLKIISQYEYLFHHDMSMNLGQISLDALMVGTIPVGGTTRINSLLELDDCGNLEILVSFFDGVAEDLYEESSRLKKELHPDKIKEDIHLAFERFKK